jgi:peptide-methionine (S)-S-oxide reductase
MRRAGQHASGILSRALLAAAFLLAAAGPVALAAEPGRALPAPTLDVPDGQPSDTIVLAGGCFWGVQGVFQHLKGVTSAVSGYAGGDKGTARYEQVATGATGHAEAVRITYDPRQISLGGILRVFFSVAHDPTQLNRQGPDVGRQYRSAIFPANPEQAQIARAYIAQLDQTHVFDRGIVTRIELDHAFYAAEDDHQDFMTRHPNHPYIVFHDLPKLRELKLYFPELYRADPALVSVGASH